MIEVRNSVAESGTPLDANTKSFISFSNPTPTELAAAQHQLWRLFPGPLGAFYIYSQIGSQLVVEIKDDEDAPGGRLQVGTQKPTTNQIQLDEAMGQLWQWAPTVFGSNSQGPSSYFIQSMLNKDLVIDIKGGKDIPQSVLQVYPMKPTRTEEEYAKASNQLWTPFPITVAGPNLPNDIGGIQK